MDGDLVEQSKPALEIEENGYLEGNGKARKRCKQKCRVASFNYKSRTEQIARVRLQKRLAIPGTKLDRPA